MKTPASLQKLQYLFRVGLELANLPVARLCFHERLNPRQIRSIYENFTRPHPRYKVFANKSMGIALVDLAGFSHPADYLDSVRQRGHAGPQGRKARARGYTLREIDRNEHVNAIHDINTSSDMRQGRPMDDAYLEKKLYYEPQPHFRCYGVFSSEGQLVAYCNVGFFGNFAATDQLMGYKNGDGVMYMLLADLICQLIMERKLDYFMYDTFLGAQPGLRDFKRRVGFRPYRVRYDIV